MSMISVRADFKMSDVEKYIKQETDKWFNELMEVLRSQGKLFTKRARAKTKSEGGFGNITWNLRSSIGFCLVYQGKVVETYFPRIKNGTTGNEKGRELAKKVALQSDSGDDIVLVLVAGEDYASFVQMRENTDVIRTSTATFETEVTALLR